MAAGQSPELDSRPQSRREWSGWLGSLVLPLALLAVIIGALFYFQSGSRKQDAGRFGPVDLPSAKNATQSPPLAAVGRSAPDFLLEGLDGNTVRLSDLQGQPVLVNFWASWCSTCRTAMSDLISVSEKYGPDGLVVLAVNLGEATERAGAFSNDFGLPFTVLLDVSGEVARTWNLDRSEQSLPWSYFIDRTGVVQMVIHGVVTDDAMAEGVASVLSEEK